MFDFNPDLVADGEMEDGDEAFELYNREEEDDDGVQYRELNLEAVGSEAREVDGTGTVAAADRLNQTVKDNLNTGKE